MVNPHPLARFSDRAKDYARCRPSYPEAAIRAILTAASAPEQGFTAPGEPLQVADIGAGTGISARLLADQGAAVIAVEPNQAMRQAAAPHAAVQWCSGQAEATGLNSHAVDLVTCFQAFHWFQHDRALPEFHRILKPQGCLALVWNDRDTSSGFTQALEALVQRITGGNYLNTENRRSIVALETSPLFGSVEHITYGYTQALDYDGLIGRCRSSSYIPQTGAPYEELLKGLRPLFDQWQTPQGTVEIRYTTHVYLTRRLGREEQAETREGGG